MTGAQWQAFSRDPGNRLSGSLPITATKGVTRHLGVDTCELTTPYTPDAYGRLAPACGAVLYRDRRQEFSGIVGSSRQIGWDAKAARPTITVQLLGDDQHLADRLVYPTPSAAPDAQTADYWTHTGPASTAMLRLLDEQAGPAAQTARRVPTLTVGPDPVAGTSRLWSEQWAPLLDTLTSWGVLSGADLGIAVTTTGDGLRADVVVPRDLTATVRFSANLSNLVGWDLEQLPPTVTHAIAAGQGNLRNRVRRLAASSSAADLAWGRRIEQLVDQRDEADPVKVLQSAADALAEGVGLVALTTSVADTPTARYGVDWRLGDRVTVHVGVPGQATAATVVDLIREVASEGDDRGREKITPAVGTADASAIRPGPTQQTLARVADGLARIIRNQ